MPECGTTIVHNTNEKRIDFTLAMGGLVCPAVQSALEQETNLRDNW